MSDVSPSQPHAEPLAAQPPRDPVTGRLLCSYCGREAVFIESSEKVYNGQDYGPLWICWPCDAYSSCHPGTGSNLGRLANKSLRDAKVKAHESFDALWRAVMRRDGIAQNKARSRGYRWLAGQLGVDKKLMHIGFLSLEGALRVIEVCAPFQRVARRGKS